jgi:hypothetical protein
LGIKFEHTHPGKNSSQLVETTLYQRLLESMK